MRRKRRIWRISKGKQLKCFRTLDRKWFGNVKTSLNSLLRNPSQALNSFRENARVLLAYLPLFHEVLWKGWGGGGQHITDHTVFTILQLPKSHLYPAMLLSKITRERTFHTQKISSPKSLSNFCSYQGAAPSALNFRHSGGLPFSKAC